MTFSVLKIRNHLINKNIDMKLEDMEERDNTMLRKHLENDIYESIMLLKLSHKLWG